MLVEGNRNDGTTRYRNTQISLPGIVGALGGDDVPGRLGDASLVIKSIISI